MNKVFRILAQLMLLAIPACFAYAAELVVIEQDYCPYCTKFNNEVGGFYHKTAEAKIAPLRRVDLHSPWPEDLSDVRIERMTPTFILVENGREVDRMIGYSGDEFFWFLLAEMLAKLDIE